MAEENKGGKSSGPSKDQVEYSKSIRDMMAEMVKSGSALEKSFKSQADAMKEMATAMEKMGTEELVAQLNQVNETLKLVSETLLKIQGSSAQVFADMANNATTATTATNSLAASVENIGKTTSNINSRPVADLTKELKKNSKQGEDSKKTFASLGDFLKSKWPKAIGAATGALSGFSQGLNNVMALGKGIGGFFSSFANGLFSVGKSILAIPFKLLHGLVDMADQGGNSVSELAEAANNMRKEFGSLSGPTNTAIKNTAASMNNLHLQGTTAFAVFGNLAERQKLLTELFAQSGPVVRGFAKEIEESGGAILGYQKGLGLTNEQMESMGQIAKTQGKTMGKVLNDVTKQADGLGKAFGLDAKIISKEIGKAAQDFRHFGNVSIKEMGVAVTYAQKLGVSLDKITGVMDSFDTFDNAAENVSKLNEAFNTNIDMGKIMEAQTPEEKLELLRKEFKKAGVEGENLNAAQRKLIAQTTGMDDQTAIAALSTKNYGVSLADIKKQGEKNEKKTLTQAEAMDKLADSMDKMLKAGQPLTEGGGLFGAFAKGFTDGIKRTKEFQEMMMSIKRTIGLVYQAGVKIGKMFVDMFPGVNQIFTSIKKLFDPGKVGGFINEIVKIFEKDFFGVLKKGGKLDLGGLMEKLKDSFFNFFKKESPEGKGLIDGFGKFFGAILDILGQFGAWLVEKLAGLAKTIADWIRKPKIPKVDVDGNVIVGPFSKMLENAKKMLWPALKDLGLAIWEKIKEGLATPTGKKILMGAIGLIFGPAIIQGILGAITGGLVGKAGGLIGGFLGKATSSKSAVGAAEDTIAAGAGAVGKKMTESPAAMVASVVPSKENIEAMTAASQAKIDWPSLTKFLLGMAALFTIGLAAFKVALNIVAGVDTVDIVKAAIVFGAIAYMMPEMTKAAAGLSEIKDINFGELVKAMLGVAGFMLVGLAAFWVALKVTKGVNLGEIVVASAAIAAVGAMMLVVGEALPIVSQVGKEVQKNVGNIIAGMLAMGLAVIAIAAVAMIAINMLGKFSEPQLNVTVKAMAAMELLFAGAGALLVAAGLVGAAAAGPQIAAAIVGFVAMGLAILGIAKVAELTINMLGKFPDAQVDVTVKAMAAMELLFAGAGALIVESAAVGVIAIPLVVPALLGFAAMSKVLDHLAETGAELIKKLGNFTASQIAATAAIMGGTIALFVAAGALIAEAAAIGAAIIATFGIGAAAVSLGMSTIGDVIDDIVETAVGVIKKVGDFTPSQISATAVVMTGTVALFQAALLVITEAGAIGSSIIGSFGMGGAAISIGMETITNAIDSISNAALGILKSLSNIKEDPAALKQKAEAFVAIITGISSMMDATSHIVSSMSSSFGFFESAKDINSTWDTVKNFIDGMIGTKKTGIIGIITAITNGLSQVSADKVEVAKAIGPLLSGVGSLMQALVAPALEVTKGSSHWFQSGQEDAAVAQAAIGNIELFIRGASQQISALIKTITDTIGGLAPAQVAALKDGGQAVGSILGAVAQMMQAMKPPDIKVETGALSGNTEIINNIPSMKDVIDQIKDNLPGLVESVVGITYGLPTGDEFKAKLDSFEGIMKVIGEMPKMLKKVQDELGKEKIDEKSDIIKTMSGLAMFLNQVINVPTYGLGYGALTSLSMLFKQLATVMPEPDEIEKTGEKFKKTLEAIGKISSIFDLKLKVPEPAEIASSTTEPLSKFAGFLWKLIEPGKGLEVISTFIKGLGAILPDVEFLKTTFDKFNTIIGVIGDSSAKMSNIKISVNTGDLRQVDKMLMSVADVTESLSRISSINLSDIDAAAPKLPQLFDKIGTIIGEFATGSSIEKMTSNATGLVKMATDVEKVIAGGLLPAVEAVEKMVETAKRLEDSLSKGQQLKIDTKLKMFATQFGKNLGSGGAYTVQAKDVNLTVNFRIAMDSSELERIMVTSGKSVIKNRIDLLINAVQDDANTSKTPKATLASHIGDMSTVLT
jgi:hypothetical protein